MAATRANPPSSITLPPSTLAGWQQADVPSSTPRANGTSYPPMTPGIGVATPGPLPPLVTSDLKTPMSPSDKRLSQVSRPSVEKDDYFSSNAISSADQNKPAVTPAAPQTPAIDKEAKTPADNGKDKEKEKDKDKEKEKDNGKSPSTPFGKKFRMGMSFGSKKLGRSPSTNTSEKPAVVDEKVEERSESSSNHEKEVEDCLLGVVQKMRNEYEKQLAESPDKLVETKIAPSLPVDTPVLKLPSGTKVIIQEETSGGSAELYRGTVETVGLDADIIEQKAPMWLGEVLLTNQIPQKDPVKVSFVLHPYQDSLPSISTADGNNRLNANRMLRVKKILAYVAERIDPPADPENPDPDALKPEEYLELYCNEQVR
jgi:WD repeat-containing protein 48